MSVLGVLRWKFLSLTNLKQKGSAELVAEMFGDNTLRRFYLSNLEIALEEVSKIVKRCPGKIVITSDHGEFLGEGGFYEHPTSYDFEILRKVPWLEVRN